jgi:hypothetical protein
MNNKLTQEQKQKELGTLFALVRKKEKEIKDIMKQIKKIIY